MASVGALRSASAKRKEFAEAGFDYARAEEVAERSQRPRVHRKAVYVAGRRAPPPPPLPPFDPRVLISPPRIPLPPIPTSHIVPAGEEWRKQEPHATGLDALHMEKSEGAASSNECTSVFQSYDCDNSEQEVGQSHVGKRRRNSFESPSDREIPSEWKIAAADNHDDLYNATPPHRRSGS